MLRQQQTSAVLIAAVALGALLLASMGLFGVVSGSVTRRRHELAVRLALGADHGRVVRLVIGEGAMLVALGVLIGIPGIYAVGGVLRGVLIDISPFDPATLAAVVAGLAAVTLIACYCLPAACWASIRRRRSVRNSQKPPPSPKPLSRWERGLNSCESPRDSIPLISTLHRSWDITPLDLRTSASAPAERVERIGADATGEYPKRTRCEVHQLVAIKVRPCSLWGFNGGVGPQAPQTRRRPPSLGEGGSGGMGTDSALAARRRPH